MKKLINIYHYGDCGKFDDNNPFKLLEEKYVDEILYHIGKSEPYTLTLNDIFNLINAEREILKLNIDKMINLNLINLKDGFLHMSFTIIFEKDLNSIDQFSKSMALEISCLIESRKDEIYALATKLKDYKCHDVDKLLYHLIGSYILDGLAIDTLSEKALIKTSKNQIDNRDYILFGFENTKSVDEFSEGILCSCNNYRTDILSFTSFGDSAGDRNDFYRFNRKVSSQLNKLETREDTKADYIKLLEVSNHNIAKKCSEIVKEIIDNNNEYLAFNEADTLYANYLRSFQYLEEDHNKYRLIVPVFYPSDHKVIGELHDLLNEIILPVIKSSFLNSSDVLDISAIKHGIDIGEILNEMWHQVFGNINETLVKSKFIRKPDYFEGEGRYLKAIYMN